MVLAEDAADGPRSGRGSAASQSISALGREPGRSRRLLLTRAERFAELGRPGTGQIANPDLPTSGAANRAVFEYNAERNANQKRVRRVDDLLELAAGQARRTPAAAWRRPSSTR